MTMATRTWNGATAAYATDADWSPVGIPVAGDTADINSGVVTAAGSLLDGVFLQVVSSATATATLQLTNSSFGSSELILVSASAVDAVLGIAGNVVNAGNLNLTSFGSGTTTVLMPGDVSDAVLTNRSTITIDSGAQFLVRSSNHTTGLVNDGVVTILNSLGVTHPVYFQAGVTGTGTVSVRSNTFTEFAQNVGSGQTIQFSQGAATVQIDAANQFLGTFAGFTAADTIRLAGVHYDSVSYVTTGASSGSLVLSLTGVPLESIAFSGDYALNSFALNTSAQTGVTTVSATGAAPQRAVFTDTATNTHGADGGTYYTGPVANLQWQYIWNSADAVAIGAQVDNTFLHGGSGDDALSVHGGTNVLDGGGGSNFLVGGTGAQGGADTFFVDGRGGVVTWSSIVNFHHGDSATIFGFNQGTSTLPLTANDGAAGYTGATIHSELNGAGTGVNGSVTFAGISAADAQDVSQGGKFTYSYGVTGGASYVNIAYTG